MRGRLTVNLFQPKRVWNRFSMGSRTIVPSLFPVHFLASLLALFFPYFLVYTCYKSRLFSNSELL